MRLELSYKNMAGGLDKHWFFWPSLPGSRTASPMGYRCLVSDLDELRWFLNYWLEHPIHDPFVPQPA